MTNTNTYTFSDLIENARTALAEQGRAIQLLQEAKPISRTLSSVFLLKQDAYCDGAKLFHHDKVLRADGVTYGPAMLALIQHDNAIVGVRVTDLTASGELREYRTLGMQRLGHVVVREGDPDKLIITEQVEYGLHLAGEYSDNFTIIATCGSHSMGNYTIPNVENPFVIIGAVPDTVGMLAAAGLMNKILLNHPDAIVHITDIKDGVLE